MNYNYKEGYVDLSMPKYIPKLPAILQHKKSDKLEYSPHEHYPIRFSKKGERQLTTTPDLSPLLDKKKQKEFSQLSAHYYTMAVQLITQSNLLLTTSPCFNQN